VVNLPATLGATKIVIFSIIAAAEPDNLRGKINGKKKK